jgi:signal transduction histidine kinase
MEITINCSLAAALGSRLRAERETLTHRWLDRIAARVNLEPSRIFPTDELLDHVPLLIDGIAEYLEEPSREIAADMPVIGKAIELGELRFNQGFGAHQILKEYEILGGVLFAFLVRTVDSIEEPCTRPELLACAQRVFRAVSVIQQVTTTHFLRAFDERVHEREERLRSFNRMVSHELKNRIGAVLGAGKLLMDDAISAEPDARSRFSRIVVENAEGMQSLLENLVSLSRTDGDARQQRHVLLPEAVAEVVRQIREMARSREVRVVVRDPLPRIEVNAAAIELCLTNYVSNAIKYSDPEQSERVVEIGAWIAGEGDGVPRLIVAVEDNGLGVPAEARTRLFERFFRAHGSTVTGVEGTGLGLSIVRETMESLGGEAWAEFPQDRGARFLLALPCRRELARASVATSGPDDPAQPRNADADRG